MTGLDGLEPWRIYAGEKGYKKLGKGVKIFPLAKIINPEKIEIGDYSQIDDFVFIYPGDSIIIGKYCHIATGAKIIGQGSLIMGDYSILAQNVVVLKSTNVHKGGYHMSAAAPSEEQSIIKGTTVLGKDVFIGAGSILHPNVKIGEGAIIGSNSLVLKDIEPWTINVGSPCRVIGMRDEF